MRISNVTAGVALAVGLALLSGAPAKASIMPLSFGGYQGGVQIKFSNYESFSNLAADGNVQVGTQNFGVFQITSISPQGGGADFYDTSSGNGYLLGIFNGITVSSISGSGSNFNTTNTGGTFEIFQVPTFASGLFGQGTGGYIGGTGSLQYNGISNLAGYTNPILTINLVPGADSNHNAYSSTDSLYTSISTESVPLTGHAQGYGDITGGTDAGLFQKGGLTTGLGTLADISLTDNFCPNPTTSGAPSCYGVSSPGIGNWANLSQDPVAAQVPEPGSLAMFGTALLGLGLIGFSRKRRKEG